jgi:hypothetical protein
MKVLLLTVIFVVLTAYATAIMTSGNSYDGLILPFIILPAGLALQALILMALKDFTRKS